jgi:putative hydrolase of HD superfamily
MGIVKNKNKDNTDPIVDFLFEAGMLAKTPRSWSAFLGSGDQSIAEHMNRTTYIGFALGQMAGDVDVSKILQMCLFHDFAEARTSDLNYVHQKYVKSDEHKALADLFSTIPFGDKIASILEEYEIRKTREALLAKDADNIEFILTLKEQVDVGNERARTWMPAAVKRLKTKEAQILAEKIIVTDSDNWWFGNKEDKWWITRNKE